MFFILSESKNVKKFKGVRKVVAGNEITHDDYKRTLATGETLIRDVMSFRSVKQQVYTVVQSKRALKCFYDKIQIQDAYNNFPYGYIDGSNQRTADKANE